MAINSVKNFSGNVKNFTLNHIPEIVLGVTVPVHVAAYADTVCKFGASCLGKAAENIDALKPLVPSCTSEFIQRAVEVASPLARPVAVISVLAIIGIAIKHYPYPKKVTVISKTQ